MNFSERNGLITIPDVLRSDGMPPELRASLWNVLHICVWDLKGFKYSGIGQIGQIKLFAQGLWFEHFKRSFSEIPSTAGEIIHVLEGRFFKYKWNEVYDFLECVMQLREDANLDLTLDLTLKREHAAYRVVSRSFVQITDEQELSALKDAIQDCNGSFAPVAAHLQRALELYSDRDNPDYRNSIKESISAVESVAKIVVGAPKATLDDALKAMEGKLDIHKALRQGFSKLYGYTSDAHGIRHAMLDDPNPALIGPAEAKYFLLSCTSFINYIKAKV